MGNTMLLKKISNNWLILLLFLIVIIICYGLLIPWLGHYFDDWSSIYTYKTHGVSGFVDFHNIDRPVYIWTHALTFPIIGTSRVGWHITVLFTRWLTVVTMWWTLYGLWPNYKRRVTWMAMIFAVYPVFFQQPVSVIYSQVFIVYCVFFVSSGLMTWAYRMPKYYWPFTILSWLTSALHIFTTEYFVGLELLRPLFLWFILNNKNQSVPSLLKQTLKKWLPFLLILTAYILWRFFFLQIPEARSPFLLTDLQTSPFSTLFSLLETAVQDITYLVFYVWPLTLEPEKIILSQPFIQLFLMTPLNLIILLLSKA
jgi:hypothetical protein